MVMEHPDDLTQCEADARDDSGLCSEAFRQAYAQLYLALEVGCLASAEHLSSPLWRHPSATTYSVPFGSTVPVLRAFARSWAFCPGCSFEHCTQLCECVALLF